VRFALLNGLSGHEHAWDRQAHMAQAQDRRTAAIGGANGPGCLWECGEQRTRAGHLYNALAICGLRRLNRCGFGLSVQVRRGEPDGLDRAATMRQVEHDSSVQTVPGGPLPHVTLKTGRGVNQHAIEIEDQSVTAYGVHRFSTTRYIA
jgi:hypothetical protein